MKETELYEPVKKWLEDRGYTVYPEVCVYNRRADVVGIKDGKSIIVEMKTSLSIELMGQGVEWEGFANQIYLAVPRPRKLHWFSERIIRNEGMGLLTVEVGRNWYSGKSYSSVEEPIVAKTHDIKAQNNIIKNVRPEHLSWGIEGGTNGGGYLTDYRLTMHQIRDYLQNHVEGQWVLMKDILANVNHHYRGAQPGNSIADALGKYEGDWCEIKVINGRRKFRYKEVKK